MAAISSSSPSKVDLELTSEQFRPSFRCNNLFEIRSALLDLNREIFSCISLRRPLIRWAKAREGREVELELLEAVGGRT